MDYFQADAPGLPEDFRIAAGPAARQESVTFQIDADVMEWLRAEGMSVQRQVNDLLRFYKDTSQATAATFEPEAWDPGEMAPAMV